MLVQLQRFVVVLTFLVTIVAAQILHAQEPFFVQVSSIPQSERFTNVVVTNSGAIVAAISDQVLLPHSIIRSSDNGTTWDTIATPGAVTLPKFLKAPNGHLFATGAAKMLLRSTDDGISWQLIAKDPISVYNAAVRPDGRLYAANGNFIFYSDDDGLTWTITPSEPPTQLLCMNVTQSGALAVGGDQGKQNSGFYFSTNNGATWKKSFAPAVGQYSFAVRDSIGTLYTWLENLYRTTNEGESWAQLPPVPGDIPGLPPNIITAKGNGILAEISGTISFSTDLGTSWTLLGTVPPDFLGCVTAVDQEGYVYVAAGPTFYRSIKSIDNLSSVHSAVRAEQMMLSSYPNPVERSARIEYTLPSASGVTMELIDPAGRIVKEWREAYQPKGTHTLNVTLQELPVGGYTLRLHTSSNTISTMIAHIK